MHAVAAAITSHPKDTVVEEGGTATFVCTASGIPTPLIRWYDDFGEFLVEGATLVRENVQVTRRIARFICDVSNDFGMEQASASLVVYSKFMLYTL